MPGPRLNAAYYAAPVAEFLRAAESEVYAPLASPHGYTLAQKGVGRPRWSTGLG